MDMATVPSATTTAPTELLELLRTRGNAARVLEGFVRAAVAVFARDSGSGRRHGTEDGVVLRRAVRQRREPLLGGMDGSAARKRPTAAADSRERHALLVVAAKIAQAVIRLYASGGKAIEKLDASNAVADTLAALDLGTIALSFVCDHETTLKLGDFVVDNMLYQLAKQYADTPEWTGTAIKLFFVLHHRLWTHHTTTAEKLRQPHRSQPPIARSLRDNAVAVLEDSTQQLAMLVRMCTFPTPSAFHSLQYARIVISHVSVIVNMLLADGKHTEILDTARRTLQPWIDHLNQCPGVDSKLASSYNDRVFRVLWKCAAVMDTGHDDPDGSQSLELRATALAFMLKCPTYTGVYFIQQVHRVGVQVDKRLAQLQSSESRKYKPLFDFYAQTGALFHQGRGHQVLAKQHELQRDYVHWIEHYVSVCGNASQPIDGLIMAHVGIEYASQYRDPLSLVKRCFVSLALAAAFDAYSLQSTTRAGFDRVVARYPYLSRNQVAKLRMVLSCNEGVAGNDNKNHWREYILSLSGDLDCSQGHEAPTAGINSVVIAFALRVIRRSALRMYNQSTKSSLPHNVDTILIDSVVKLATIISDVRKHIAHDDASTRTIVNGELRVLRLAIALPARSLCNSLGSSSSNLSQLKNCVRIVNEVFTNEITIKTLTLDEAMVTDFQVLTRDLHACGSHLYRNDCVSAVPELLAPLLKIAESILGQCVDGKSCAILASIKMESIALLVASSIRDQSQNTVIRNVLSSGITCASDLAGVVTHDYLDKFVTSFTHAATDERQDWTSVSLDVRSTAEKMLQAWRRRRVSATTQRSFILHLSHAFDRACASALSVLRANRDDSEALSSYAIVKTCTECEQALDRLLHETVERECPSVVHAQLICRALSNRNVSFATYYATSSTPEAIHLLTTAESDLSLALDEMRKSNVASRVDIGGSLGWRGVVQVETSQILGYERKPPLESSPSVRSAQRDIQLCLEYLERENHLVGHFFDAQRILVCLSAVCSALSLMSCLELEARARAIIASVHSSTSSDGTTIAIAAVPPRLMSQPFCAALEPPNEPSEATLAGLREKKNGLISLDLIDAEAGLCASSLLTADAQQATRHYDSMKDMLDAFRMNARLKGHDSHIYKAIAMREVVLYLIGSEILLSQGELRGAVEQAKSALTICWKLSKKVAIAPKDSERHSGHYKLPDEVKQATTLSGDDSTTTRQLIYFQALECWSWDVLLATKLILSRIAELYIYLNDPRRSSVYYSEAIALVGGLDIVGFRKQTFLEFAEFQLLADRTSFAAALHRLLSVEPTDDSSVDLSEATSCASVQGSIEKIQRGDLCTLEGNDTEALIHYQAALEGLGTLPRTCRGWNVLNVQGHRKIVQQRIINFLNATTETLADELISSLRCLKRSLRECKDLVEEALGVCQLARGSLVLLRSSSPTAFLPIDKVVKLLEGLYPRVEPRGIARLSCELRLALGSAYLTLLDSRYAGRNGKDPGDVISVEWKTAWLLGNCSAYEMATKEACEDEEKRMPADYSLCECVRPCRVDDLCSTAPCTYSVVPSSWSVINIAVGTNRDLILSMMPRSADDSPLTFCLGNVEWARCIEHLDTIISRSRESLNRHTPEESDQWTAEQKKTWWHNRIELDDDLGRTVKEMESVLGFWRTLLVPIGNNEETQPLELKVLEILSQECGMKTLSKRSRRLLTAIIAATRFVSDQDITRSIDQIAVEEGIAISAEVIKSIKLVIMQEQSTDYARMGTVCNEAEAGLIGATKEKLMKLKVADLRHRLSELGECASGTKAEMIERLVSLRDKYLARSMTLRRSTAKGSIDGTGIRCTDTSVVLILDKQLEHFPWEGIDVLRHVAVTRMPSIELLIKSAKHHFNGAKVDRTRVSYLVNPAGDLGSTQETLEPILHRATIAYGWRGIIGTVPDEDTYRSLLSESDLFIYCGHGSGEKYFHREKMSKIAGPCSAALLFGCSSGYLKREGIFGPHGTALAYLRASSPSVLAMLWDVTDKDIDKLSVEILTKWVLDDSSDSTSLSSALQKARGVCKLRNLNGLAPVCYGIPLVIGGSAEPRKKRRRQS